VLCVVCGSFPFFLAPERLFFVCLRYVLANSALFHLTLYKSSCLCCELAALHWAAPALLWFNAHLLTSLQPLHQPVLPLHCHHPALPIGVVREPRGYMVCHSLLFAANELPDRLPLLVIVILSALKVPLFSREHSRARCSFSFLCYLSFSLFLAFVLACRAETRAGRLR
jgi:hypothetical protein